MPRLTQQLRQSQRPLQIGWLVFFLLAIPLFFVNLGSVALRDWDEGIVAQISREMARSPIGSSVWLYPVTPDGTPYLNKPPLIHWLVALAFRWGGVNEWMARLPGATLTALSVPLVYILGRELFPRRTAAIFAMLVYLTLLPVVRHGRLAMLDGGLVCFFLLMVICLLRSRRDLRWSLGVGLSLGAIAMTKGAAALLLGAIGLGFLVWDTPRLLTSTFFWSGTLLGVVPALGWYLAQVLHYGQTFIIENVMNQSLSRVWRTVEANRGPFWYYLLELVKYTAPWLLFLPQGLRQAWENRNLSWAKLLLVWLGGYLLVISIMSTKLPWYLFPIYPAFALVVGNKLAEFWRVEDWLGGLKSSQQPYPRAWAIGCAVLAIATTGYGIYLSVISSSPQYDLLIVLLAISLTLIGTAGLIIRQNAQFILVLVWGCYVSLFLLMMSPHWLWELNERYPVKPVASMVQQYVPKGQTVWTSYQWHRPSLNFYSDRTVLPANAEIILERWQQDKSVYLLVDDTAVRSLNLSNYRRLAVAEGWFLIERQGAPQQLEKLPSTVTSVAPTPLLTEPQG